MMNETTYQQRNACKQNKFDISSNGQQTTIQQEIRYTNEAI